LTVKFSKIFCCFFSPFNPGQFSLTPLHSRQESGPSRIAKFLLDQILPVIHSEIFNLQHFATPFGLITFTSLSLGKEKPGFMPEEQRKPFTPR